MEINNLGDLETAEFSSYLNGNDPLIVTTVMQLLRCSGTGIQCLDYSTISNKEEISIRVLDKERYTQFIDDVNETYDMVVIWPDLKEINISCLVLIEFEVSRNSEKALVFNALKLQLLTPDNEELPLPKISYMLKQKVLSLIEGVEKSKPKPTNIEEMILLRNRMISSISTEKENIPNQKSPTTSQRSQSVTASLQEQRQMVFKEPTIKTEPGLFNPMLFPPSENESQFPVIEYSQSVISQNSGYQTASNIMVTSEASLDSNTINKQDHQHNNQQQQQVLRPIQYSCNENQQQYTNQQTLYQRETHGQQYNVQMQPPQLNANERYQGNPYSQTQKQSLQVEQQVLVPSPANLVIATYGNSNQYHPIPFFNSSESPKAQIHHHISPSVQHPKQFQQQNFIQPQANYIKSPSIPASMTRELLEKERRLKEKRYYSIRNLLALEKFAEDEIVDLKGYLVCCESPEFTIIGQGINEEISIVPWGIYLTNIPPKDRTNVAEFSLIPGVNCLYMQFTEVNEVLTFFGYNENDAERVVRTDEYNNLKKVLETLISCDNIVLTATAVKKRVSVGLSNVLVWKTISTAQGFIQQMRK